MQARTNETVFLRTGLRTEAIGAMGALVLGIFVVFMVGFAGSSVLHEAAHNTRHSIAFPCH
ncbi:MAG: CbtB domain-containing protein [Acetobacteraceae bacterium]